MIKDGLSAVGLRGRRQIVAPACVHALFSHLEEFLWQGHLLPDPLRHKRSKDQPAYEFPTGDPEVRVLVRKIRRQQRWLLTAWAADGDAREVRVEIPVLGIVHVRARPEGAVYRVERVNDTPSLVLMDTD